MNSFVTAIGMVAAVLTTIAFIPQLVVVVKTKSTKDISLAMFIIFSTGVFLWLAYGTLIWDWPLIIANAVTFILAMIILAYKIKYK